jgi:hypothetical protein
VFALAIVAARVLRVGRFAHAGAGR